jgi:hypothetical protein
MATQTRTLACGCVVTRDDTDFNVPMVWTPCVNHRNLLTQFEQKKIELGP